MRRAHGSSPHERRIDDTPLLRRRAEALDPSRLASEGVVLSDGILKTLRATYLQAAQEAISRYENDAAINSLTFDRHQDGGSVAIGATYLETVLTVR